MNDAEPYLRPCEKEIFLSFDGYNCTFANDYWILNRNITLNLSLARGFLPPEAFAGLRRTLKFFAMNSSASHTQNLFSRFGALLKYSEGSPITPQLVARYRQTLGPNHEWYLGAIRVLVKQWNRMGYEGLDSELPDFLSQLVISGNRKGEAVKQLDSEKGPLSDIELLGFNDDVVQAYEMGSVSVTEVALSMLVSHTGSRSVQITGTKLLDLSSVRNEHGEECYFISIPRGKQPGRAFRSIFRRRAITEELFLVLTAQATYVIATVIGMWSFEPSKSILDQLPLFPNWDAISNIHTEEELISLVQTDWFHLQCDRVTVILKQVSRAIGVKSERTGKSLKLTAMRFRYTIGTRAAREGYGPMVIAELLDHSDTQNVGVYVQNVPEHAAMIDQAVASQLVPFAQAFAGVIVSSKSEAVRGADPDSEVRSITGRGTGTCGCFGFCSANVPIPCYTCVHFQPWLDGPHQEVLSELLAERNRIKEITQDIVITSVLDRSILAVTQVVEACDAIRASISPVIGAATL